MENDWKKNQQNVLNQHNYTIDNISIHWYSFIEYKIWNKVIHYIKHFKVQTKYFQEIQAN